MAGYGIRAHDSSGRVIFDTNKKMTKILGRRSTGTSNGSFSHPAFSQGQPFGISFIVTDPGKQLPKIYPSGNRIYWEFPQSNKENGAVSFIYGVYL